jgi:prepilin-type N-terminal cleavage/methylation domain-containing protein
MNLKGGFTIIELVIATAIVALLIAVGLPRFTTVNQKQQFVGSAQKIAECIQAAQTAAAAPAGGSIRYTSATVTATNPAVQALTCQADSYAALKETDGAKRFITRADIMGDQRAIESPVRTVIKPAATISGLTLIQFGDGFGLYKQGETGYPASIRVFFGVNEGGKPVYVCRSSQIIMTTCLPPQPDSTTATVKTAEGFPVKFYFRDISSAYETNNQLNGLVSIPPLGSPISYEDWKL